MFNFILFIRYWKKGNPYKALSQRHEQHSLYNGKQWYFGLETLSFICRWSLLLIILIMAQKSLKMVDKYQFNINKFTTT